EIVIDRHLQVIGIFADLRQVRLRAEKRTEAVRMPNMPTYFVLRFDRLDLLIDSAISLVDTIVPHCLPRQDLGIAEDDPPQRDIVSIRWPLPPAAGRHPLFQRVVSLESA